MSGHSKRSNGELKLGDANRGRRVLEPRPLSCKRTPCCGLLSKSGSEIQVETSLAIQTHTANQRVH
jgi:hypothetical protein